MNTTEDLYKELEVGKKLSPLYQGVSFFVIECRCEFEPFGRASETWEEIWRVTLPLYPWMWKNTNNEWVVGSGNQSMYFEGKNLDVTVSRAISFLREYKVQLNGVQQK